MQTINPISDPDEIRRERDAEQPQAASGQSAETSPSISVESGVQQPIANVSQSASDSAQPALNSPVQQPAQPVVAAANPFAGDYQMPAAKIDTSAIYPNPDAHKDPQNNVSGTLTNPSKEENVRIASIVPGLQIYAILILVMTLWTAYSLWAMLGFGRFANLISGDTMLRLYLPSIILGIANISAGVYFLIAKRAGAVSVVLLILLIGGGLGILNSISSMIQYSASVNGGSIFNFLISVGLWFYLLNIRSQVELLKR